MSSYVYQLSGKVLPERAGVNIGPLTFGVSGGEDVPQSTLHVQILWSQIFARLTCPSPVKNHFTARNLVEDCVRSILDAAGFVFGRGYDVEITQYFATDPTADWVFGVDIGVLEKRASEAGLTVDHLAYLMSTPTSWFFRRALADFREAIKNATDTGFFCYRAIETLMQCHAALNGGSNDSTKWRAFRDHYNVSEDDIRNVKSFADPIRHGNGLHMKEVTSGERARIFELAWDIGIKVFLRAWADNPPPQDQAGSPEGLKLQP